MHRLLGGLFVFRLQRRDQLEVRFYFAIGCRPAGDNVDPQRPLSEQGVIDTQKLAGVFGGWDTGLKTIYHSQKKRAFQTAEIIKDKMAAKPQLIEQEGLLPNDPTDAIYDVIQKCSEDLLIVGHLPFLPKLVSRLIGVDESFVLLLMPASSLVVLQREDQGLWLLLCWSYADDDQ